MLELIADFSCPQVSGTKATKHWCMLQRERLGAGGFRASDRVDSSRCNIHTVCLLRGAIIPFFLSQTLTPFLKASCLRESCSGKPIRHDNDTQALFWNHVGDQGGGLADAIVGPSSFLLFGAHTRVSTESVGCTHMLHV